jgi:hypothetical protein
MNKLKDLSKLVLVYKSEDGQTYEQFACDLPSAGTLIDPETGDDMELVGWYEVQGD